MNKPLASVLAVGLLLAVAPSSEATMKMQKEAKELGFPSANCLYCHNERLPTKAKVTNNERGAFLVKMKADKKAKDVDMAWLKDFVEPKK